MQPDTLVPEPGNPQTLNRYAYVYNNPLRYTDPSGYLPWWAYVVGAAGLYVVGRIGYEVGTLVVPGADQTRRDQVGGRLVVELSGIIKQEAEAHAVDLNIIDNWCYTPRKCSF